MLDLASLHRVRVMGDGPTSVVLGHGFGTNQGAWDRITCGLNGKYRLVLFDFMGCNERNAAFFDSSKYRRLDAHARDLVAILTLVGDGPFHYVGHSMGSMIGLLASIARPDLFAQHILIAPSPCYMNLDGYHGGFERKDVLGLVDSVRQDYVAWVQNFAPAVVARQRGEPETEEFTRGLLAMRPDIALTLLLTIFMSDYRDHLVRVGTPTVVLQPTRDMAVPRAVTDFIGRTIPRCTVEYIDAAGHLPHLTHPDLILAALNRHLP